MAVVLDEPDQLQVVRDKLRLQAQDHAGALRAYSAVQAVLSEASNDQVVVDAYPNFSAIIIKGTTDKKRPDPSALLRPVVCHSNDVNYLEQLLDRDHVLPWDSDFILTDCDKDHAAVLQVQFLEHGRFESWPSCDVMVARKEDMQDVRVEVPEDYRLCPVPMEAGGVIQTSLPRRPKGSLGLIHHEISYCPSSCVLGPSGELVAYALSHARGGISLLDVHPTHRGLGLARCVLADLAIRVQERDEPVWACVDPLANPGQAHLLMECGFKKLGSCRLYYYRP